MSRTLAFKAKDKHVLTPLCVHWTRHGHMLHLTRDLMPPKDENSSHVLMFPAFDAFEEGKSITTFLPKDSNIQFFFSPRDYDRVGCDTKVHPKNSGKNLAKEHPLTLTTRHGQNQTTHEQYLEMAKATSAIFVEAPNEESLFAEPQKARNPKFLKKFQAKTLPLQENFLREYSAKTENPFLFVSVQGGLLPSFLKSSAETVAKWETVDGFVIEGIPFAANTEERKMVLDNTIPYLPPNKLRIVHRVGHPFQVLELIEDGIDIFSSNYVSELAYNGYALSFPIQQTNESLFVENEDPIKINLFEKIYRFDTRPLTPNCDCVVCLRHTRAYLHHLVSVHEMLAWILLSIHNLRLYDQFFSHIRTEIEKKTFHEYKLWFEKRAQKL